MEIVSSDSARWDEALGSLPASRRDVYALRPYYEAHALLDTNRIPECAIAEEEEGTLVYPYFRCPLSRYPWLDAPRDSCDIITAYGYGGIYGATDNARLLAAFLASFGCHCRGSGVVAELIRLNPLLGIDDRLRGHYSLQKANDQIVVALQRSDEEIWKGYRHNNRKNISKALRSGVEIVHEGIGGARFGDYLEIYAHTMKRREAKQEFLFPAGFYDRLAAGLGGNCRVFYAVQNGRTLSVELVLCSETAVYSFLGGTMEEFYELRPNNLLKHEIIRWAREKGYENYLLGGGPGGSDGIFEYKRSFSPEGVVGFTIATRIHDRKIYNDLINKCLSHPPQSSEAASAYPLRWMYGSG